MLRKLFILSLIIASVFAVAGEAHAATCTILTTNLRSGSSDALTGNMVSSLIRFLQESGYVPTTTAITSGKMTFGPQTLAGLKQYQLSQKLAPTGVANIATRFRILLSSCNLGGLTPASTAWQAGSSRAITWNKGAIRAAYLELALKKSDTAVRYTLATYAPNNGTATVLLPASLPTGTYSLEARFALALGGKYYALGYPVTLASGISVSAAARRSGGGGGGSSSGGSTDTTETTDSASVSVSRPDIFGSMTWTEGSTQSIQWSFTDGGSYPVSVKIIPCAGGVTPCSTSGQTNYTLSSSISGNTQSWTVGKYLNGTSMGLTNGYHLVRVCKTSDSTCSGGLVNVTVSGTGSSGDFSPTFTSFTVASPTLTSGTEQVFSYSFTKLHHLVLSFSCSFNVLTGSVYSCQPLTITPGVGATSGQVTRTFSNTGTVNSPVTATLTAYNDLGSVVGTKTLTFYVAPPSALPEVSP